MLPIDKYLTETNKRFDSYSLDVQQALRALAKAYNYGPLVCRRWLRTLTIGEIAECAYTLMFCDSLDDAAVLIHDWARIAGCNEKASA